MVLLDNFVLLVENLKQHPELNQVEVICRVVECSITIVVLQRKANDRQDESANEDDLGDNPDEMSAVFERLSESVANYVKWKPRFRWQNKDAPSQQELHVSIYEEPFIMLKGKEKYG